MTVLLAIDQGSSSSRCVVLDPQLRVLAQAGRPLRSDFPASGWVQSVRAASGERGVVVPRIGVLFSRLKRVPIPPYTMPGFNGSPAVYPLSPPG